MSDKQTPKSRPKPSCATCAHFMREGENGFCRRYPPSLRVDNGSSYVPVKLEWVCGEWSK
jgi:hypothetical protein